MTMTTIRAPARPPKPERRKRRYTPLPDPQRKLDMKHGKIQSEIRIALTNHFGNDPTTLVGTEGYLILKPGDLNGHPIPDCIIAFGVEAVRLMDEANGYIVSEVGKPPDLVVEIGSKSTGKRDYTEKRKAYRDIGAPEYWRFDYTGGQYHDAPLAGDILVDGEYRAVPIREYPDGTLRGYSPRLGLYFVWDKGDLRFFDPVAGDFLPDPHEYSNERNEAVRERDEAARERDEEREARIRSDRRAVRADQEVAAERDARVESERRAEAERAARAESDRRAESERAARAESDSRAAEAEAEVARLRRLLGDLG